MIVRWLGQILAVMHLELQKTFFSRRGVWVYLLALVPVLLFWGHSIYVPRERERLARIAAAHPLSRATLNSIQIGDDREAVLQLLGEPYWKRGGVFRMEGGRTSERAYYRYTDGKSDFGFRFVDGKLTRVRRTDPETLSENTFVFATIFQFYYLRLAVFFGCLGIFMNLFRGEMLDRSLHFYLLTPMRRETLLLGKYLTGLLATIVIFATGAVLQFPAMLAQFDNGTVHAYLADSGWSHFATYLGVTVLACVGYGSIFLTSGLLFRNPIVPAAVVLVWESANLFVPASLKHLSLIYYLQSLCPVVPPSDPNMPLAVTLLVTAAQPATIETSITVVAIFTLLVLAFAAWKSRKLEINYAAD